jgi:hypothetical protein
MKHLKFIAAAVIITAASLSVYSCKRGANDPFLSFRSRDGRLAGTWKLVGINGSSKTTSVSGSSTNVSETTTKYENGTQTVTNSGGTTTSKYDFEMTLEKDGAYTSKTTNYNNSGTLLSTIDGDGTWSWLSDGKNKSNVVISDPTSNIANGISEVDQLKAKELVIKRHARSKNAASGNSYEVETNFTYTFEAI